MFGLKAYLIMGAIMATMIGGFYWYYQDSQARIATLTANNAKLELAVKTNEETIAALQQNFAAANAELTRINDSFAAVRAQNRELSDRLSEHDMAYLASKKPGLVEKVVNGASDKVARCFELLSGAALTDAERNATDGKSFNSECPWLFDTLAH